MARANPIVSAPVGRCAILTTPDARQRRDGAADPRRPGLTAQLNAKSNTGRELFSSSRFSIPIYQREYAWSENEYQALWEDLRGGLADDGYFLGLIILTQDASGTKEVVDGQQRILSISLLAAALRDRSHADGRTVLASEIERDFLKTLDLDNDAQVPRISFSDTDDAAIFASIINGSLAEDQKHPMAAAYRYFVAELDEDLGDDGFKRLGAWTRFLQEGLYFAVFTHPDSSSAYTVFEVVNTRGRNLADGDLLKNSLLRITPDNQRRDIYTRWSRLAAQFDDYHENSFVQFIRHVAMLDRGYILPKELHRRVTRGTDADLLPNLIDDLETHLDLYLQILDPSIGGPASDEASRAFSGFNVLGVSAVRPLLLALGPDAEDGFQQALKVTLQIACAGSLGGVNLERRFSEAATSAKNDDEWLPALRLVAPTREEFVTSLPRRKLRKAVLQLLHRSIVQATALPSEDGHLQMIRPPVAPGWDHFADEEFTEAGMTLGNGLLTEKARRPKDCLTWGAVKTSLLPSALDPQEVALLAQLSEWTVTEVRSNGSRLAEMAADVWY